jgi:hypothetical protein
VHGGTPDDGREGETIGLLVPEPGFEPGRPCGHGILRRERRGNSSRFYRAVAFSHYEGYG